MLVTCLTLVDDSNCPRDSLWLLRDRSSCRIVTRQLGIAAMGYWLGTVIFAGVWLLGALLVKLFGRKGETACVPLCLCSMRSPHHRQSSNLRILCRLLQIMVGTTVVCLWYMCASPLLAAGAKDARCNALTLCGDAPCLQFVSAFAPDVDALQTCRGRT